MIKIQDHMKKMKGHMMNGKGQITVFVSLLLCVIMVLFTAVSGVVSYEAAKTKSLAALSTAQSGIKADYNRYVYDRYHILLVDKDYYGRGEGELEKRIVTNLKKNLGKGYEVDQASLSGATYLMENDFGEFKEQIKDYFLYEAAEYTIEELLAYISDDNAIDEDDEEVMDEDVKDGQENVDEGDDGDDTDDGDDSDDGDKDYEDKKKRADIWKKKDPRPKVALWAIGGIQNIVKPLDIYYSSNTLELSELPSYGHTGIFKKKDINFRFDDYETLKSDARSKYNFSDALLSYGAELTYIPTVFNAATDRYEVNDTSYLYMEMEYLIAGQDTDQENFSMAVHELLALRFSADFVYILTDSEKMEEVDMMATALTFYAEELQPFVKYYLAGAWAYAEAVTDLYRMLHGSKVAFIKTYDNWKTDLDSIGDIVAMAGEETDDEFGLDYKQYLMLLISLDMKSANYRMMDLMQTNARYNGYYNFDMTKAITEFSIDADIGWGAYHFYLSEEAGF